MKRLLPSLIILVICLGVLLYGRASVLSVSDELNAQLASALSYTERGDFEDAQACVARFYAVYEEHRLMLDLFVRRQLTDTMLSNAAGAQKYAEEPENSRDFIAEMRRTIASVEAIRSSCMRAF